MNNKNLSNKTKYLINVCESFILFAERIKRLHNKYIPNDKELIKNNYMFSDIPIILRLLHNIFFFDTVLNLKSLLVPAEKNKTRKEQSIFELINLDKDVNTKKEKLSIAEKIKEKYSISFLPEFRNKLVAHKDLFQSGDIDAMYFNFVEEKFLEKAKEIILSLKDFICKYYEVESNNSFYNYLSQPFEKVLNLFENELKSFSNKI